MKLLTVRDVATELHMSESHVYTIKGRIGYIKLGGAVRFRPEDVRGFIDRNRREEAHITYGRYVPKHL